MAYNILIVDDFKISNEIVANILEENKYQTFTSQNAQTAIRFMKEIKMDVVITDYKMPLMNGIELLAAIREMPEYKTVPVIFLSSIKNPEIIKKAKGYGISAWVSKPINNIQLKKVLANILNK